MAASAHRARAAASARQRQAVGMAPRWPVLAQPDLQRAAYFQELRKHVARLRTVLMARLAPVLAQFPVEAPREDARQDAGRGKAVDDVQKAIRAAARDVVAAVPTGNIERLVEKTAGEVSDFSRQQLRRAFSDTLGVNLQDAFTTEPKLRAQVATFTQENVALIRSIPDKYFAQVEQLVVEGVQKGMLGRDLAKLIQERTGVAESRAALIARDQVGKFNGALNAARMRSLGVKRFRWRTMRDSRVRRDHEQLEDNVYAFDEPPSEGLPGHPVNCRCYAEPLLDELLDEEPQAEAPAETVETLTTVEAVTFVPVPVFVLPPPPPRGEIRGEGKAVAAAHPVLAQILGAKLKVEHFDVPEVRQQVEDLAALPPQLLERMAERVSDVHVADRVLSEMGDSGLSKQAAARGPDPTTVDPREMDTVGGIYLRGRRTSTGERLREVLVATKGASGSLSTVMHEMAHAVDLDLEDGVPFSSRPDFVDAWRHFRDNASGGHLYAGIEYVTTEAESLGQREAFAEASAIYYKHGYASVAQAFGYAIATYLDENFSAAAWARRFPAKGVPPEAPKRSTTKRKGKKR